MGTKELLKKVKSIEIRTSHIVDDMLSGQYHSAFRGRGIEFEEVRPYQIGDDVRTIDWNVTARYNEPFVKLFHEERELTVMLLVDLSASLGIGSKFQLKRELVAELGATLAHSAIRNNDKVGMLGFTSDVETVIPPRTGPRQVLRVIRELLYARPANNQTNIARALQHLNKAHKHRSVVFLISDFQDDGYETALRIAKRRHDVIPIVIADEREFELPDVGLVELLDAETNQLVLVDTSSRRNRRRYTEKTHRLAEQRDRLFKKLKIDSIHLRTDEDFIEPLRKFFRKREVRLSR